MTARAAIGMAATLCLCMLASSALAASPDSTRTHTRGALIFESGFSGAAAKPSGADGGYGSVDVGYLGRVNDRMLLGADLAFIFHDDGVLWAFRPHVRRELGNGWGLDVAPGIVLAGAADGHSATDGLGASVMTEIEYKGIAGVALTLQSIEYSPRGKYGDLAPSPYSGRVTSLLAGVRAGKLLGGVAAVAVGLATLGAVSSL